MEIRRSVEQVQRDLDLLREVAAALAVKYQDRDLAGRVDALCEDLSQAIVEANHGP